MTIDLNADVGEGYDDAALYSIVSSVNVACGEHAGDDESMRAAVDRALHAGCAVGAHPGYPDRDTMGRASKSMYPAEVVGLVATQVRALETIARGRGARLSHVKPHGALYNQAAVDFTLARAVAAAVAAVDSTLVLVGLAGSALIEAGFAAGLRTAGEAFCDRAYESDGTLVARGRPGALIDDVSMAAAQGVAIASGAGIGTVAGTRLKVDADTLCIHGDTPGAAATAGAIRSALEKAGVAIHSLPGSRG